MNCIKNLLCVCYMVEPQRKINNYSRTHTYNLQTNIRYNLQDLYFAFKVLNVIGTGTVHIAFYNNDSIDERCLIIENINLDEQRLNEYFQSNGMMGVVYITKDSGLIIRGNLTGDLPRFNNSEETKMSHNPNVDSEIVDNLANYIVDYRDREVHTKTPFDLEKNLSVENVSSSKTVSIKNQDVEGQLEEPDISENYL